MENGETHRMRDVAILGIGFMFIFTSFNVLQMMASSLFVSSVAFASLGTLYVSFGLSNVLFAAPAVAVLGSRLALVLSSLLYSVFAVTNVGALIAETESHQRVLLLPAAALTGFGASVLWAAQSEYVARCALPHTQGKYAGLFFGLFWIASIFGPLLARILFALGWDKVRVFAILATVGFLGPLTFCYLWLFRPEPSNPYGTLPVEIQQASINSVESETQVTRSKFLDTFKIMTTRAMIFLAPLFYTTSMEQTFSGGSLPLFIKTGDSQVDFENKLFLQASFGTTLMISSFVIGKITDRFGSRPLMVFDVILHGGAMAILWFLKPVNNFVVLFPCAIVLAFSDSLLMNQIYKLLATLYPAKFETTAAFAGYKFHQSLVTGLAFMGSKYMLGADGIPNMNIWAPLVVFVLVVATVGVFLATSKLGFRTSGEELVVPNENTPLLGHANNVSGDSQESQLEQKRLNNRLFDVLVMAIAFFFIFSAFMVIQGLASSVLPKSVAFAALGNLYFSFALGNLFLAAPIVDLIGCRSGVFAASVTYSLFNLATIAALQTDNDNIQLSILIPAAWLNGFGASVLWTAESVYITKCACKDSVGRYAGYFFAFVGCANLAGPMFSSLLLQLQFSKIEVFKILFGIGSLGPLLLLYIVWSPPPSNPFDVIEAEPVSSNPTITPQPHIRQCSQTSTIFKTVEMMISPTILLLAPISYFGSAQMAFNGGSIPLFINTGDTTADMSVKLYLVACMGAVSTVTSATVGPFTDRYGPRVMLSFAFCVYTVAISVMRTLDVLNNLWVLGPCVVAFAFCSNIIANQIYKIMGVLFAGTATAFASQRFHGSLGTGVIFSVSGLMLDDDGIPDMKIWAPLVWGLLIVGISGAFVVTRDMRFRT